MSFKEKRKVYRGEDDKGITAFKMSTLVVENEVWTPIEIAKRKSWIIDQIETVIGFDMDDVPEDDLSDETPRIGVSFMTRKRAYYYILLTLEKAKEPLRRLEIVNKVYSLVKDELTDVDKMPTLSGRIRWEGSVRFAVTDLRRKEWLKNIEQRNQWIITDLGRNQLRQTYSENGEYSS